MKYKYWFSTGPVEIEIGSEWESILKELDKKSRAINYWDLKKNSHYDALDFEPDFMGANDAEIELMFDETAAFEYVKSKISTQNIEILQRKAVLGETFKDISKAMGLKPECVRDRFKKNAERFRKYYSDGVWLNSDENINFPGIGKVLSIPYKLTPDQVVEIRALRALCCSLGDIAKRVGVAGNQVIMCLMENPVMKTICPTCGKIIEQPYRKKMRSFCSTHCYIIWYKKSGDKELFRPSSKTRIALTDKQIRILQFYKQRRVSYTQIREMTNIPLRVITAYFLTYPLPYTICKNCGAKVWGQGPANKIKLFCNTKCADSYYNREKYARKYKGIELYPEPVIPEATALEKAIDMREAGFSDFKIRKQTGLTKDDIATLFRYELKA